jgi:hypothetical protein
LARALLVAAVHTPSIAMGSNGFCAKWDDRLLFALFPAFTVLRTRALGCGVAVGKVLAESDHNFMKL